MPETPVSTYVYTLIVKGHLPLCLSFAFNTVEEVEVYQSLLLSFVFSTDDEVEVYQSLLLCVSLLIQPMRLKSTKVYFSVFRFQYSR